MERMRIALHQELASDPREIVICAEKLEVDSDTGVLTIEDEDNQVAIILARGEWRYAVNVWAEERAKVEPEEG